MTWTLTHGAAALSVAETGATREAQLTIDDEPAARAVAGYWEKERLERDGLVVEVRWGPRNHLVAVDLLDGGDRVPFRPPPGSRAARREALALEHPTRFTLLRVGTVAGEMLLGILGVGALLAAVAAWILPNLSMPSIPLPDWDLPDLPDPLGWLWRLLPDVDLPDLPAWVRDAGRYVVPLVVAVVVARGEIRRRREREARRGDEPQ